MERTLPHNLDAERSVLGCLLIENHRVDEVADTLAPGDFYRDAHQRIYQAIRTLRDQRVGIDFVTLKEELDRRGELAEVGGPAYVGALPDGMPKGVNLLHYANIVREKAQRRRLIFACNRALADAYDVDTPIEDLIERTERDVLTVGEERVGADFVFADQWARETYDHIEHLVSDPRHVTGVSTGFTDLDRMTRGLQPGELIILGARPSMGKTALMKQMALHAAQTALAYVASIEMSARSLGIRAFALEGHVNSMRLMTGRLKSEDYGRVQHAYESLRGLQLAIDDSSTLTMMQLRAKARRLKAQRGLGILFVDYLQLLQSPEPTKGRRGPENRTLELAEMSRSLKALAKELQIPVVALSQLSRDTEKREVKRPRLSDLRESGAIEQDADVVLLLHRPEYYQETPKDEDLGRAEVIIAKQRNGPTGIVELRFTREFTRFDNWS